ncbi:MAG: adenylate/guanylate cyclase protein with TPR [Methylocystaceae bacterium]|nr:MAG: adenylate/guanylate cyclase protein with TPR [Methylocystaceae bacterium]
MDYSRNPGSPLPLRLARVLLGLLNVALLIALALVLLPLVTPYFKHAGSYRWIEYVEVFDARMIRRVKSVIPTNFKGYELARWFIVGGLLFGRMWVDSLRRKITTTIYRATVQRDFEALQSAAPADARVLAPVKEKMKTMDARNPKSRAELLKVMGDAKRQLESMGRDLAFLSIDVVDSTKMKLGEDKTFIEHDFREYKDLVDSKLRSNGSLKAAWTPDGVMACFPSIDAALKAAKEVIAGLDAFNANVKMIKSNFTVRCGINAGRYRWPYAKICAARDDRLREADHRAGAAARRLQRCRQGGGRLRGLPMGPGKPSAGRARGFLTQPQSARGFSRAKRSLDATYATDPLPSGSCAKSPVARRSPLLSLAVES